MERGQNLNLIPLNTRVEVRYAREVGDYARLDRVTLPDALGVALANAYQSEDQHDGYGPWCFVCSRGREHRGEHSDWQYVAKEMGLF